jgi:hypothetical protein
MKCLVPLHESAPFSPPHDETKSLVIPAPLEEDRPPQVAKEVNTLVHVRLIKGRSHPFPQFASSQNSPPRCGFLIWRYAVSKPILGGQRE